MGKVFKGNTAGGQEKAKALQAADSPFLPAAYWEKGRKMAFVVVSTHKSSNGPYVGAQLVSPPSVRIDGKDHSVVRIGNLAGITLARLQALDGAKNRYFMVGDKVHLECTGVTPPEKQGYSPSPNFELELERETDEPEEAAGPEPEAGT